MQVLREISSQTADSTSATSQAIGKLAELAAQLRKSVTGFRLPGLGRPAAGAPGASTTPPDPEGARSGPLRNLKSATR
jgi:hypothetical protein